MTEPAYRWPLGVGIIVALIMLTAYIGRTPEPICAERDLPTAERVFSACIAAQSGHNTYAAFDCRREANTLACKAEARP